MEWIYWYQIPNSWVLKNPWDFAFCCKKIIINVNFFKWKDFWKYVVNYFYRNNKFISSFQYFLNRIVIWRHKLTIPNLNTEITFQATELKPKSPTLQVPLLSNYATLPLPCAGKIQKSTARERIFSFIVTDILFKWKGGLRPFIWNK